MTGIAALDGIVIVAPPIEIATLPLSLRRSTVTNRSSRSPRGTSRRGLGGGTLAVELGDAVLLALERRGEDDREDEHDDAG